jgi:hypothetical protein
MFFSVELLRPLVSINKDFFKFFIFEVLKNYKKSLLPDAYAPAFMSTLRYATGTGAQAEHTRKARCAC